MIIFQNYDLLHQQCKSATPHPDSFWESCQIHCIAAELFFRTSSWLFFDIICITDHDIFFQIDGFVDPTIRALEVTAVSDIWAAGCRLLTCLAKQWVPPQVYVNDSRQSLDFHAAWTPIQGEYSRFYLSSLNKSKFRRYFPFPMLNGWLISIQDNSPFLH